MGIGTGRPGIDDELRAFGLPSLSPDERLAQIGATITALRILDGDELHTPVVIAAGGPRARALAAELADTVTFAMQPDDSRADAERMIREFRQARDIEVGVHVSVVGDGVAPFMASVADTDPAALRAADSLAYLSADPGQARDEIQRRRDDLGASYVVIGADFADILAPVVAELAGT